MARTRAKKPAKALPAPAVITETWPIASAYNAVRVVLTLRTSIGHYYTGVEILDNEVGIWHHVPGSAQPHTTNRSNAADRVQRLLEGKWTDYVDPNTTKPKKVVREVASARL